MKTTHANAAFLAVGLLLGFSGCALFTGHGPSGKPLSAASRYDIALETHTALMQKANELIESGVIKDQQTKDVIFYASEEVNNGLKKAKQMIADKNFNGFELAMSSINSALDRLASINFSREINNESSRIPVNP